MKDLYENLEVVFVLAISKLF